MKKHSERPRILQPALDTLKAARVSLMNMMPSSTADQELHTTLLRVVCDVSYAIGAIRQHQNEERCNKYHDERLVSFAARVAPGLVSGIVKSLDSLHTCEAHALHTKDSTAAHNKLVAATADELWHSGVGDIFRAFVETYYSSGDEAAVAAQKFVTHITAHSVDTEAVLSWIVGQDWRTWRSTALEAFGAGHLLAEDQKFIMYLRSFRLVCERLLRNAYGEQMGGVADAPFVPQAPQHDSTQPAPTSFDFGEQDPGG